MDGREQFSNVPRVLARSEFARKVFQKKIERKQREEAELTTFRARECEVTKRKPFQPVLEHNRTVPGDVVLHSTVRAKERQKFDGYLHEKNLSRMQQNEEERVRREAEEREAIKRYRRKLEFKARPMPTSYCGPQRVQPTARPLTVPETPLVLKRAHSK